MLQLVIKIMKNLKKKLSETDKDTETKSSGFDWFKRKSNKKKMTR